MSRKVCEKCIYYGDDCSRSGEGCNDFFPAEEGEDGLAEHETDLMDFTGDEDFDDFMEHEDMEFPE